MNQLEVTGLSKRFGHEVAVDHVDVTVKKGEIKTLLGPSGCGKTTLLRCIAGLETPDKGTIKIGGETVEDTATGKRIPTERRDIGMVFQSYAVWPHMSVTENVMYPLKAQKIGTKQERKERVQQMLALVDLEDQAESLATHLSGGQQQRVSIARALAPDPEILLLDEPLSNLDAKLRREMRQEIKSIQQQLAKTILYVTHSQDEAMYLADEIAIMRDGNIVEEGEPEELHLTPKTHFGMNFMGHCNTFEGNVTHVGESDITIDTPVGELISADGIEGIRVGDLLEVSFRPKHCSLTEDGTLRGELISVGLTRDFAEYTVDVQGHEVLVRTPDPLNFEEGDTCAVAVSPEDVRLFASAQSGKQPELRASR